MLHKGQLLMLDRCRGVFCILLVLLAMILSACSYYYYTVEERTGTDKRMSTAIGYLQFEAGKIYPNQTSSGIERFIHDDSMNVLLEVNVYVMDTVNPACSLRIVVDSARATFADEAVAGGFVNAPVAEYYRYGRLRAATIKPVRVRRDYKQDFILQFRLRAYDDETGELLMDKTVAVTIKYHRERYFIFDAPYG